MPQTLKSVDFTKTQKSRYLDDETLFFLQIKKNLITHQELLYGKKHFCSGGKLYCVNVVVKFARVVGMKLFFMD